MAFLFLLSFPSQSDLRTSVCYHKSLAVKILNYSSHFSSKWPRNQPTVLPSSYIRSVCCVIWSGLLFFFSFFHLLADLDILLAILRAQNLSVLSGLHRLINAAVLLSRQQHTAFRFTKQDLVLFYLHLHVVDLGERGAK